MMLQIHYGTAVATVPAAAIGAIKCATKNDIQALLLICERPQDFCTLSREALAARLSERVGCTEAQAESALSFWRGAGVLEFCEDAESVKASDEATHVLQEASAKEEQAEATPQPSQKKKPSRSDELPHYTTAELSALLAERQETAAYLDECARVWGRIFNIHETNVILGLSDYLGLEWDYILALLSYCVKVQNEQGQKKSLHYVEKIAFSFYDEGVTNLETLQSKLRAVEQLRESEGQIRALFGMGSRAMTPKEKKSISTWIHDYGYDMEIIRLAYEATVDAKGSFNISYMNSVLANWNRDGLRTPADVERAQAAFASERDKSRGAGKKSATAHSQAPQGSFDTGDFFNAAVRRSLGDDFFDQMNTEET